MGYYQLTGFAFLNFGHDHECFISHVARIVSGLRRETRIHALYCCSMCVVSMFSFCTALADWSCAENLMPHEALGYALQARNIGKEKAILQVFMAEGGPSTNHLVWRGPSR